MSQCHSHFLIGKTKGNTIFKGLEKLAHMWQIVIFDYPNWLRYSRYYQLAGVSRSQ